MAQSERIGQLADALAKAQGEIRHAVKDAQNPHLKNRYADLNSVWDACREVLPRNGLAVAQGPEPLGETIGLRTVLMHASGEWIDSCLPLTALGNKGVNEMQALGSAMTYARRYGLAAIVGVCADDDDGHGSGPPRREQRRERERESARPAPSNNGYDDRQAVNQQFPASSPPAASSTAGTFRAVLDGAISYWEGREPAGPDQTVVRRQRIVNSLISWALYHERCTEDAIAGPTGKRDKAKCWEIAKGLYKQTPKEVRQQIRAHIDDAIRRDQASPAPARLPSADPTLPPVPAPAPAGGPPFDEFAGAGDDDPQGMRE